MPYFNQALPKRSQHRQDMTKAYCQDESKSLRFLLSQLDLSDVAQADITDIAQDLVQTVRLHESHKGGVDALMSHYNLTSEEGILLMCLAEALLRIPDKETEDLLIKDKLSGANWSKHLGASESRFVNMATWGLAFTGKILADQSRSGYMKKVWFGMLNRCGEPVIREAIRRTMKTMSEHFVLGRNIKEALKRSKELAKKGYLFSYDMLGEMARTEEQAKVYYDAYETAINAMGEASQEEDVFSRPTISIKLSALHPRYEFTHRETVVPYLVEKLKGLVVQAKNKGIRVTVDAEEAARLDISLDIFEKVFVDPAFDGWNGFGLAVQAYQKRGYAVLEWLIELARTHNKKIPVRLVKGAYWDTEIKIAQVEGFENYPVFTRKAATDVSYLACAKLLLSAQDAIYPGFATHNAYSAAAILWMTKGKNARYEFQNLQGMGGPLHDVLIDKNKFGADSRIYAPVGRHEDLLPYLVRRLLENGANTSFVHQIADPDVPVSELVECPVKKVMEWDCEPNPNIPLPKDIYPHCRQNSQGFDVTREDHLQALIEETKQWDEKTWTAAPFNGECKESEAVAVTNPNDHSDVVGYVRLASETEILSSLTVADEAVVAWDQLGVANRAELLEKTADLIERDFAEFVVLLRREAGKTIFDAIAEIREAVDFCRYYAVQARLHLIDQPLQGPTGESNTLRFHGRGVMACISPWNFPLAIFTGQVVASLVAGNCVIAKPAGQTPLLAAKTIALMYEAGIPKSVVCLMPGSGSKIGSLLLADDRIAGVLFTGSTETAKTIQHTLADRSGAIVPFIAETGGMNAMIVDSSALLEQLVMDVMVSAFGSAGQRCSALRVLFVQADIADQFIEMLKGAMATWQVGRSGFLATDVGPVIDHNAQLELQAHIDDMYLKGDLIAQMDLPAGHQSASFVAPAAFEIPELSVLTKEVFGPVLHVVRFKRNEIDQVVDDINGLGYGLTFGIQSRIQSTIDRLQKRIKTGNIYVNRTMIGAVVGVQPFGGCGLSGTGPKAGGPHYLMRLVRESTLTVNTTATGGNAQLLALSD